METQSYIFLGIKVKPGPIERHKLENFGIENTIERLRNEAEKKTNIPSSSLELVHHGKLLKDNTTLQDSGIKNGEMIHVVKRKVDPLPEAPQSFSDAELQQIITALRTFGCTPNAPGWTRAMQVLNDESTSSEITEAVPSLREDCVTLSILHEVELLAAIGANVHTIRRAATARPDLPVALRHLTRLVRSRSGSTSSNSDSVPTSGFAYSLEALSEDEDAEDEETEEGGANIITQEQLSAALQAASEAVSTSNNTVGGSQNTLFRLLRTVGDSGRAPASATDSASTPTSSDASRSMITPEMFSNAISEAMNRFGNSSTYNSMGTPMEQSTAASTSQSPESSEDFSTQLVHMHEMGLLDDAINVQALLVSGGDVNAAINLVFSGAVNFE